MHYQSESLTSNAIEENEIDETNKISLVINTGFNTQDAEWELHHGTYFSDLCNEDKNIAISSTI